MADIIQEETDQTNTAQIKTNAQPPQAQLVQMAPAHWTSRILNRPTNDAAAWIAGSSPRLSGLSLA
jgi:hypothetical protein